MRGLSAAMAAAALLGLASSSTTLAGCADDDESGLASGGGGEPSVEQQIEPAPGGMRRIMARQFVNSVRAIFGDAAGDAADPPVDTPLHGFDAIGNAQVALPINDVEAYETTVRDVARAVIDDADGLAALLPCKPSGPSDSACFEQFIRDTGRLAWRRPLEDSEVDDVRDIAVTAAQSYDSFEQGVFYAITALLQSPHFIYLVEVGEPDGERRRLTQVELASRLAFFLTDTTPDDALLDKAEAGELDSPEAIREVAEELLAQPQAQQAVLAFYDEQLRLRTLDTVAKNDGLFPDYNPQLQAAMRQEVLELIEDIVWKRDSDARELLTAKHAFVNGELAGLYGVSGVSGSAFVKVTLPAADKRVGFLGTAAFNTLFSHAAKSSPTKRGLFIRRNLLCDAVPPPPAAVVPELPDDDPSDPKTMKQKLTQHMEDPSCNSCHALIDPLGFPYEVFDAIGRHRDDDQGLPIDTSGETDDLGEFADAAELAAVLADSPLTTDCMVRTFYRGSMGHLETEGEEPAIVALRDSFDESGFRVQHLLVEIVASPAFSLVGDPK